MKSILTFILATFLLFPLQAQEKVYTVDNLPKVHLQNKMQYVCNPAGILSQAACDSVSVSAILSCRPFFILIFLLCIKMKHYGFSRKSIWKNLETFP